MANIKDPFGSYKSQKILVSKSLNDLGSNLESANYIRSTVKEQQEFEPHVDYTTASNFARYGSAEQYYKDAFSYIQDEYPYDGSGKEKVDWEIRASGLDRYIFEKEYPRTSGHITMGTANAAAGTQTSGYFLPGTLEYIIITGSYQPAKGAKTLRTDWDKYNLYDTSSGGNYNLEINGDNGVAVEFWWKKDSYAGQDSSRQVILDLWNRGTTQASVGVESTGEDWGRFTVEIDPGNYHSGSSDSRAKFWLRVFSGSDGLSSSSYWRTTGKDHGGDSTHTCIPIGQNLTLTGANWTHYGFNIYNTGSEMAAELYVNGTLNERIITGSSINPVTGAMISTIGSLVTNTYGGTAPAFSGWLSASLDEFRYWRRKRTAAQIGQYWFTQVGGGTNTDITNAYNAPTKYSYTNPVDLGVYYKFNEGILNSSSINPGDKTVLDYSGRVSNGNWVGYTATARSTASAIIDGGAATSEFKDPILYSSHPDVSLKFEELKLKGFEHDINNNAAIFQSVPGWIRDEDIANDGNTLLKLTQIIASYFDTLQLQIQNLPRLRDVEYLSSSYKPLPFTSRLIDSTGLDSAELFADASEFEALAARDDFRTFSEKLNETKNKIYQNLYNNLVYIFKSKGTAKSIRNLIRCYGVGDELVKLNLYADQVTSDIKENYESSITRKKYVNFYETGSFNASVYQDATVTDDGTGGSSNTNVKSTLSSSTDAIYQGNTLETEIIFPEKRSGDNPISFTTTFITSSLFGVHTVTGATNTTWAPHDSANFQVSAIRGGHTANDAYFKLSSTTGGSFPTLTSSIIKDVYNNSRWNMAVRIKPTSYPWTNAIDGTELSQAYDIEFLGYQTLLDSVENQFKLTGSISFANGQSFLSSSKRVFAGAHRTNFNSTVLQQSDVKISSVRYWNDYLEDKVILAHARDPSNFGRLHPGQNKNLNQVGRSFADNVFQIPQMETLALQWNFDTVTGSDTNGEFIVEDYSSGSIDAANPYGFLNQDTKYRHPGKGIGFPTSNADVTVREYVYTAKQQLPEVISSDDMIDIKTESDVEISIRDTRPIRFFFAVEKSLYASVSAEMIKFFATVLDFNNLIGEPVNRYRQDYKALEKMRQLFFERVQNDTVDFEKFVDYFKWIDESIGKMVVQLFPVTANFSRKVFTMIESHVLERNKYWNKFPTLEMKAADPEAGLYGINEMLYSWKRGKGQVQRQASFDNLLTFAGHSINDKFTVNVPTAGGVPGVDITVKLVSGTPSAATANQVEVSTAGTTAAILARFVIAIAGGTPSPSNSVAYGSGAGDATNGIAGITAALGTNPTITVTATQPGAAGNDIVFTDVVGTIVAGGAKGASPAKLVGGVIVGRSRWHHGSGDGGRNNFTVPSGTGSATASAIPFITASDCGSTGEAVDCNDDGVLDGPRLWGRDARNGTTNWLPTDFAGLNFHIYEPVTASENNLGYPLPSPPSGRLLYADEGGNNCMLAASYLNTDFLVIRYGGALAGDHNLLIAPTFNALMLHRNGPYQYPSWKQIRTGQHPIVRYQKRNNLSTTIKRSREVISGKQYKDTTTSSSYTEPVVTFKYRPLETTLINSKGGKGLELIDVEDDTRDVALRHSYGNNLGFFANEKLTEDYNLPSNRGVQPAYADPASPPPQMNDLLLAQYKVDPSLFRKLKYSEIVYPREINTSLNKTRQRTQYAETASGVTTNGVFTASISSGPNGIDRGPLYRRTFWRNKASDRNRKGATFANYSVIAPAQVEDWFTTTITNSCGIRDGHARSVWCFGSDPIWWLTQFDSKFGATLSRNSPPNPYNDGRDTGELNSINIMKIGGLMGGMSGSAGTTDLAYTKMLSHQLYMCPTASAYYYWLPFYGIEAAGPASGMGGADVNDNQNVAVGELSRGMKWTADVDSGKKPWFDSYEEYAEDLRGLSQNLTILPEFRISDHMPYYIKTRGKDFTFKNDKFLKLNGANITQSAITEATAPVNDKSARNFDQDFFKEYSTSDFQKYFGTFSADHKLSKITLKCNAVKKLLPYKGFYPADRSLQLVSLFSGGVGQHVSGGALTASGIAAGGAPGVFQPTYGLGAPGTSGSYQLALQTLLQPWFAPGILYNTIKSGIAVDWPIVSGNVNYVKRPPMSISGVPQHVARGSGFISSSAASKRLPFKSLLDPLNYLPVSSSSGSHKLLFLAPSYQNIMESGSMPSRIPYFEIKKGLPPAEMNLYKSAMHNYLVEIPNFFLSTGKLKSIESKPQSEIQIEEDKIYVMDVFIEKTNIPATPSPVPGVSDGGERSGPRELIMIEDYYNGQVSAAFGQTSQAGYGDGAVGTCWQGEDSSGNKLHPITASYNGKYFGPKWDCRGAPSGTIEGHAASSDWYAGNLPGRDCDPAHAPHTPPYFYGKARVRLTYTGSAEDIKNPGGGDGVSIRTIFTRMTASFKGLLDPRNAAWTKFNSDNDPASVHFSASSAYANMMDVTASLNIKGLKTDQSDSTRQSDRWVISPFMETPVLDFSGSENFTGQTPKQGYGRGMWSGYGETPKNNKGIYFGIEDVVTEEELNRSNYGQPVVELRDMTEWFKNAPSSRGGTGIAGAEVASDEAPQPPEEASPLVRTVGEVAVIKTISEAIIAIPFINHKNRAGNARTTNKQIMDKYFFSLGKDKKNSEFVFDQTVQNILETEIAIPGPSTFGNHPKQNRLKKLFNYYNGFVGLEEEIDETSISRMAKMMNKYVIPPELDFNKSGGIEPFAMYILPFEHDLDQQDLVDIWQGLMPEISRKAELDTSEFSHNTAPWEFFGGKRVPEDVRWMVFKVKERAHANYDATDPTQVNESNFASPISKYSYNWPYDYFSLVELAEIEVENEFDKMRKSGEQATDSDAVETSEHEIPRGLVRTGEDKSIV